jgi:hypothetical protein
MPKLHIAIVVFAIGFSSTVSAQTLTAEQRAACKPDYDKYCSGTTPGGGRIIACLNKQHEALSEGCRKVLDAQKKK